MTATARVTDSYDKRGGALEFLVNTTRITDQDGALVAQAVATTVIRQPSGVTG